MINEHKAAWRHLAAVREALRDGPLSPAELKAATGLSRHQIGRARLLADDQSHADPGVPMIVYSAQHNLYVQTNNGIEIGRALLPQLRGQVTRCSRVINVIEWVQETLDIEADQEMIRSKKEAEAHRQLALDQIEAIEAVIASAD